MTPEILFLLLLLPLVLLCLVREWLAPEVAAMTTFVLLLLAGILDLDQALSVFSHPAPITIGALFVITHALDKTGGLDGLSRALRRHLPDSTRGLLLGSTSLVALASAFINNTPIVALFLPLLLGLARVRDLPPSKLLIPLSYASILGGCCTLLGSSTNLIVSGIMAEYGYPSLGMFELGRLGAPLAVIGIAYIVFLSPRLLPARASVTAALDENDRKSHFCQLMVTPQSRWIGRRLVDTVPARADSGFRLLEVRRKGTTLVQPLNKIIIEPFDRVLISASPRLLEKRKDDKIVVDPAWTEVRGLKALATQQGGVTEGVVGPHSRLNGRSLKSIGFRQHYGMWVLAVHRQGRNLHKNFQNERLQFGDTLLLLGPKWRFDELRERGDLMLLDETTAPPLPAGPSPLLAWAAMAGVVLLATLHILPIAAAALAGAVFLLLTRVVTADEAARSIDTSILFLIFGMLGLGLAMETTGAAKWLAENALALAEQGVPNAWLPHVALALVILLTGGLTELLSNNATAALMAPVAYNLALGIGVDTRPFFIAVMFAASLAFATPIGYQTNTMVFNAGGYCFGDFVRAGLPLSLLCWTLLVLGIPVFWPF